MDTFQVDAMLVKLACDYAGFKAQTAFLFPKTCSYLLYKHVF